MSSGRRSIRLSVFLSIFFTAAVAGVGQGGATPFGTFRSAVPARAPTVMYWGTHRIGTVNPGVFSGARDLAIDCPLYSGGGVETNAQGTYMVVFSAMNYNFGFARLLRQGKWAVRAVADAQGPSRIVGYTERRAPLRWDVFKGSHKVGYTVGPDGPQAAAALLLVCT